MPTEAPALAWTGGWTIRAGTLAGWLVGAAVAASTIVFSEPAIADVLMLAVVAAVPVLGVTRYGTATLVNLVLWLAVVGLALVAMPMSTSAATGIPHQLVTLFLVLGAVVLAGFIADDPEPRFELVMWCYLAASLIATAAAIAGYFNLLPGVYDLFTNYGRARGTFKDPNVYGAAVAPALAFAFWQVLRGPPLKTRIAAAAAVPLVVGLLLSFSRGAWISMAVTVVLMMWLSVVRTRRKADRRRFGWVAGAGIAALLLTLGAASQIDKVRSILEERASLDQSYDYGPDGRFGGQAKARRLILEHPFGIGTHTFRATHHHEEPHNVYFSMFLSSGWIGGAAYVLSLVFTLMVALRAALRTTALQGPMIIAGAAFAGLVVEGFVIDSDHWRHFFIVMACIWGLADGDLPERDPSRRKDDPIDG